jgi:hypothetical protein
MGGVGVGVGGGGGIDVRVGRSVEVGFRVFGG